MKTEMNIDREMTGLGSGDRREDREDRRGERDRDNRSYREDRREGRGRDTRGYRNDYHYYNRDINNPKRY